LTRGCIDDVILGSGKFGSGIAHIVREADNCRLGLGLAFSGWGRSLDRSGH
jgi:hypothetical protein